MTGHIKYIFRLLLSFFVVLILSSIPSFCKDSVSSPQKTEMSSPVLKRAVLCEKIINGNKPYNQGVVFPSSIGSVICLTDFDPVHQQTYIYHEYYFKDKLSARIKLTIYPPRWSTYSRIQLRETDKGPWRVEIKDVNGNVLRTIRFSITD